jgi:hypothetical protein
MDFAFACSRSGSLTSDRGDAQCGKVECISHAKSVTYD